MRRAARVVARHATVTTLCAPRVTLPATTLDVIMVRTHAHVVPVCLGLLCVNAIHPAGAADVLRQIMLAEGQRGLWRIFSATLALVVSTTGLDFTIY